jgi:hypothetical protein
MALDAVTATLLGTAIGSLLTLAVTIVQGIVTLRKESLTMNMTLAKERVAGEIACQKEREARAAQRYAEFETWRREQLHSSLSGCAYLINLYISLILKRALTDFQKDPEAQRMSAELQKQIVALLAYCPDKENTQYNELREAAARITHNAVVDEDTAWALRTKIVALSVGLKLDALTPASCEP